MAGAAPPEQHNWRIAQLYARNEFDECLAVVEKALTASNGLNEYPLYVKALITRQRRDPAGVRALPGRDLPEPVERAQPEAGRPFAVFAGEAQSGARRLRAGSKFKRGAAQDARGSQGRGVSSRRSKGGDDWELWHNSGLCHAYLKQYDEAINAFERANANQRHDATFLQLGKVHEERGDPGRSQSISGRAGLFARKIPSYSLP